MDSYNRLVQAAKSKIAGKEFLVVSHGEPYVHYHEGSKVKWRKASGGLVTALQRSPIFFPTAGKPRRWGKMQLRRLGRTSLLRGW